MNGGFSLSESFAPTIDELIKCAERELAMRERVYPRLVVKGKMKPTVANLETALMAAIVDQLRKIKKSQARF